MKLRMRDSQSSTEFNSFQHAARIRLKLNALKIGLFRVASESALGTWGRRVRIHSGPPETLENLERKSWKTVFLGSQPFSFNNLQEKLRVHVRVLYRGLQVQLVH